jgi:hypothetical protein
MQLENSRDGREGPRRSAADVTSAEEPVVLLWYLQRRDILKPSAAVLPESRIWVPLSMRIPLCASS